MWKPNAMNISYLMKKMLLLKTRPKNSLNDISDNYWINVRLILDVSDWYRESVGNVG